MEGMIVSSSDGWDGSAADTVLRKLGLDASDLTDAELDALSSVASRATRDPSVPLDDEIPVADVVARVRRQW